MLRPVFDRLLIEPLNKKQTESGLHLPDENVDVVRGSVFAKGPEVTIVQRKNTVLVQRKHCLEVKDGNGKTFLVIQEEAILAIDEDGDGDTGDLTVEG